MFAFASRSSHAATIFVDPQLGSATCATYNPASRSCSGGSATAFQTIAAASAVAMPGDNVRLRGGTYGEQLRPATSGIPDLPITYAAYQNESVLVGTNSTSNPGILLSDRSNIVIEGVQVQDRAWCEARNTHYCVVRQCTFLRTPATGTTGNVRFISATFNRIIDCTFLEGNDNLVLIDANNNLVEGCTLGVGRHSVFGIRCGDYNIVRGNYMYNPLQHVVEVFDCGVDTSAVPNDFNSTHHNIFEDNIIGPCALGAGFHDTTSNGNGIQYGGQDGIIRRNILFGCNVGLGMQVYEDESLFNVNNRIYHNVFAVNMGAGLSPRGADTNAIYKNNIFYGNGGCINGCVAATSPGQIVYRTNNGPPFGSGALFENNDLFYGAPGDPVFEIEFSSTGQTVAQFSSIYPAVLFNTLEVDPQFENAATNNFHLRFTSPLIDAGAFLTRATIAGAGFLVPVEDAFSFTDGFGIPGEIGDVIQLEGQMQTARILTVDYVLNTLLLDMPLVWNVGQGIALRYNGAAPDLGAFETGADTPVELSATYSHGTIHLTWPEASGYVLRSADNVSGPYTPSATVQNSYAEPAANETRFFQLMRP